MKVYVGLSANKSLFGRIIRWLTRSEANHAFLLLSGSKQEAVQIDSKGVRFTEAAPLLKNKKKVEIYQYEPNKEIQKGFYLTLDYIGSEYDYLGIFGFLIKLIFSRLLMWDVNSLVHRKGEYFCSEYVATVISASGISLKGEPVTPENTSPGTLRRLIRKELGKNWTEVSVEDYLKIGKN